MIEITNKSIESVMTLVDSDNPSCGGVVTFVGKVRNHHQGRQVLGLTYEAYPAMAQKILEQIRHEAIAKFGVTEIHILHRVGILVIGEIAVWVCAESGHRGEAFAACRYVIDELKLRAPIWKKEHYADGESDWVICNHGEPA